jgi:hypothetical protein
MNNFDFICFGSAPFGLTWGEQRKWNGQQAITFTLVVSGWCRKFQKK